MKMIARNPMRIWCNAAFTLDLQHFLIKALYDSLVPYLSKFLMGLFKVRGFPQMFIRVQVDVRVVLTLRRVAVALLTLLQALWV